MSDMDAAWDALGIQQAYITWNFAESKLDPNRQLAGMKRLIHDRLGGFTPATYALDCGRNFRFGIEKLPVIQDAFQCWKRFSGAPADQGIPAGFIMADNVVLREGFDEANNAYLHPKGVDPSRLRECSMKIVGLNVPVAPVRAEDIEALREAFDSLASRFEGEVAGLRAQIAALKGTPPEPTASEVIGRALRW